MTGDDFYIKGLMETERKFFSYTADMISHLANEKLPNTNMKVCIVCVCHSQTQSEINNSNSHLNVLV